MYACITLKYKLYIIRRACAGRVRGGRRAGVEVRSEGRGREREEEQARLEIGEVELMGIVSFSDLNEEEAGGGVDCCAHDQDVVRHRLVSRHFSGPPYYVVQIYSTHWGQY